MSHVKKIVMVVHQEDLFNDTDGLDANASADKFVALVAQTLEIIYPVAEIVVDLRRNVSGVCPKTHVEVTPASLRAELQHMEEVRGNADQIAHTIWEKSEMWFVEA